MTLKLKAKDILAANIRVYSLTNIISSEALFSTCKVRIFKSFIRLVLTYRYESWTLTKQQESLYMSIKSKVDA